MRTVLKRVDPERPDGDIVREAAALIQSGGLVAFPTDTVYGLAANGLDEEAVRKLYRVKERPKTNPVSLLIAADDRLPAVAVVTADAALLAKAFWPGPLTLVLPAKDDVPELVTAGSDKVGVRVPACGVALAVLEACGVPLAVTSANRSGKPSPRRADEVLADFDGAIDMVLDGGPVAVGIESAVLDMTTSPPTILRPGLVGAEDIADVIGVRPNLGGSERPRLPKYRGHARIILGDEPGDADSWLRRYPGARRRAVIASTEFCRALDVPDDVEVVCIGDRLAAGAAMKVFSTWRELDRDFEVLIIERLPEQGAGIAVMDRLAAASESEPVRLLAVCTGNTCRSPMAERLLREAAQGGQPPVEVRSAGIAAGAGRASEFAREVMKELGHDLSDHLATPLDGNLLEWADVVLVMSEGHRRSVLEMCPAAEAKTYLAKDYAGIDDERRDVDDPFGGSIDDYRRCREVLRAIAARSVERMRREFAPRGIAADDGESS